MPPSRSGPALLGAALAFGVVANVLSRTVPGRLDVALGVGVLVLLLCLLVERGLIAAQPGLGHLGIPLAFLTGSLIWRDSAVLFALNLLGIVLLAALASPRVRAVGRSRAGLSDYTRGAGQVAGGTAFGAAALLFVETDWRALPDGGLRQVRGATVGLLAAAGDRRVRGAADGGRPRLRPDHDPPLRRTAGRRRTGSSPGTIWPGPVPAGRWTPGTSPI